MHSQDLPLVVSSEFSMAMIQSKHPLSLPEIRSVVAQYLDNPNLAAAALVSRDWNATCSSVLYETAEIDNTFIKPNIGLSAHAKHVRDLTMRMYRNYQKLPLSFFIDGDTSKGLVFTRLKKLYLKLSFDLTTDDWWKGASLIATQNPGLEELRIATEVSAIFINALLESCPRLARLSFSDLAMNKKVMGALLNLCTANRLDSLIMKRVNSSKDGQTAVQVLVQEWASPVLALPLKLEVLKFGGSSLPIADQIAWAQRCPQLKVLELHHLGHKGAFPTKLLCEALSTTLAEVNHLHINHGRLALIDLVLILSSFGPGPRIKYLGLGRTSEKTEYKPRVLWPVLNHHLSVLTHLNMRLCSTFSSETVQHALASFPHLISLQASCLKAKDIIGNPNEAVEVICIAPWVCKNLQYLQVPITGFHENPAHWNTLVLGQISTLKSLEVLDIQLLNDIEWYNMPFPLKDCLDIRLQAGLSVLANLKRMRRLSCSSYMQRLGPAELEWMKNTWPRFDPKSN